MLSNKYYDETIEIEITSLLSAIQDIIKELEECAKNDDFVSYCAKYEELDTICKTSIIDGYMTEEQYNLLERKYGK